MMDFLKEVREIPHVVSARAVGSQTIPGAATPESDYDFVVTTFNRHALLPSLEEDGWTISEECYARADGEPSFDTARKGLVNLIIYTSEVEADRFFRANLLAIRFGLVNKPDRVDLFREIMQDRVCELF